MVGEDLFDNLTAKRFNLHQCKSIILGGLQNKIYPVSPVQIRDRSCGTFTFLASHVPFKYVAILLQLPTGSTFRIGYTS